MPSAPVRSKRPAEVSSLSHDEWWALFDQLRLSQQTDYSQYGGPVAFVRKERNADSDLS